MDGKLDIELFPLLLAQDFQWPQAQDSVAGQPACCGGEDCCAKNSGEGGGPFQVVLDFEFVEQCAGEEVGEDSANGACEQSEDAELD